MALEWGKQISFSGLKKRAPKQSAAYPSKTYINLVVTDKKTMDVRKTAITAVVAVIVVALFVKFGVMDFYGRIAEKEAELSNLTRELSVMQSKLTNYNAVLEEYEGYESISIGEDGLVVDVRDALALVDTCIAPHARISSIALAGDTMTLGLADVTLDGVGLLVNELYGQSIVDNVSVSTATNQQTAGEGVTATMTVKLKQPSAN